MDWLEHLAIQGTLKSLLQHHSSKASILQHSAFFTVQRSHLYMTTGKTIALAIWTFVCKAISLLFNRLFRFVIALLPRSKQLLFLFLFFYYYFFIFTLFYFTILYWFCHTLTWIHHGCTCVPKHEPPSLSNATFLMRSSWSFYLKFLP